jgi:hypothetical protein
VLKRRYLDAADIEDINTNGSPDAATLFQDRNTQATYVVLKDGGTKRYITSIKVFGKTIEPIGMATIGDQTGDLISEIAVLGIRPNGSIRVWVVNLVLRTVSVSPSFFGSTWTPIAITRVQDLNSDNVDEIGVLAMKKTTSEVFLQVKEEMTWVTLKFIPYSK